MDSGRVEFALDLVASGDDRGIPLRLIGGLAVEHVCPGYRRETTEDRDVDVVALSRTRRELTLLLSERGLEADRERNAIFGHRQLYFSDPAEGFAVDVLLDRIQMCHTLDMRDRLESSTPTIPSADLLLSKLQIVEINQKDLADAAALLSSLPLTDDDTGISLKRVAEVVASDWGWYRTSRGTLELLHDWPGEPDARLDPGIQARRLSELMESWPKTGRWKWRARIGERKRWYELPREYEPELPAQE